MPAPKKPHILKRTLPHLNGVRYMVDFGIVEKLVDGKLVKKRDQRFFKSRVDAEDCLAVEKEKLKRHGETAISLSEEDRLRYQAAQTRLDAVGATITEATDFYLAHHKPLKELLTLKQLFDRAYLEKKLANLRPHSLSQFACGCRSFLQGRETMMATSATRDTVKEWVAALKAEPPTKKTYLGDVRTLFSWGVQERYLRANPLIGPEGFIQIPLTDEKEITCFDLWQCEALLRTALFGHKLRRDRAGTGRWDTTKEFGGFRELLGYIASAMILGVRPEENRRTIKEKVDVLEKTLVVTGSASKGRSRRVLDMEHLAVIWMRLWRRLCPGAELIPTNFRRKWEELREAAGLLADWPHDILRHTAATMHYARYKNRAALQAMLGHSEDEDTLDKHYRAVSTLSGKTVSLKMATQFYGLTPRRIRLNWEALKQNTPALPYGGENRGESSGDGN